MNFPLAGNGKIADNVLNAIKTRHLPHAILIEGDVGTGRHTLADFITKAAVCSGENPPCGECRECKMLKSGSHPDVTIVSPPKDKKNITVSQIRELRNDAFIKPHQALCRVFIIDFADTMNLNSQNALLKILEEPPGATYFILIAESKASLLDTVISRCVTLTLSTPSKASAMEYIRSNYSYETDKISDALDKKQNNIGKTLLELAGKEESKTSAAAREYLNFFLEGSSWGMLKTTAPLEKNRIEAENFLKDLKYAVSNDLRKNPNGVFASALSKFYSLICELEKSLITNINLSLLFASLSAKATEIIENI